MDWTNFSPGSALLGGLLIGISTGLVLLLNGKIAGISGVFGRILRPAPGDVFWRVSFLIGLVAGAAVTFMAYPPTAVLDVSRVPGTWAFAAGGLLVGFGTQLGNGCTSGHGVCGVARGSRRSVLATLVFIASGAATVALVRHVAG